MNPGQYEILLEILLPLLDNLAIYSTEFGLIFIGLLFVFAVVAVQ